MMRAKAFTELDEIEKALADLKLVTKLNQSYSPAKEQVDIL